ncbi:MAG: hypothetical protein SV422_07590, partial [Pseudomonadota bacterium]|nr:hypothetical protein [Pseudomonadota bacterium]
MSNPALEAEVQRLQCLQALGITVYHPRYRLPGAKPSVQGPWPESEAVAEPDTGAKVETLRAAAAEMPQRNATARAERQLEVDAPAQRANVRAAFDAPVSPAPAQAAAPVAQPRKPEGAAVAVQNFQLLFLQIDADLVVVNQIPALARPQLHDKPLALLTNLLRWLGKSVPAQAPR